MPKQADVAFEPIVDLSSRAIIAREMLCRKRPFPESVQEWREFYDKVFAKIHALDVPTAFNLDTRHILDTEIWPSVERFVDAHDAQDFIIEWTEHEEGNHAHAASRLRQLAKKTGIGISIDDMGAGQDGLSRLAAVECVRWIKIDGPLLHRARTESVAQHIIHGLCGIAGDIGAHVIAEWTETAADIALAAELGASHAQGFFFGENNGCHNPWAA